MSSFLLRKYHKDKININPFSLSGNLYPLINNGHDEMIEDKQGIPVPKSYANPVRIATLKKNITKKDSTGTPVTIEKYVWFMISDWQTIVDVRLEFEYEGKTLKVTQRKEIKKFGAIHGYEYELKDLTRSNFHA